MLRICNKCGTAFEPEEAEKQCPICVEKGRRLFRAKLEAAKVNIMANEPTKERIQMKTIIECRESTGMTAREMADKLGLKYKTYWHYENKNIFPVDKIDKFAEIVKVEPVNIDYKIVRKKDLLGSVPDSNKPIMDKPQVEKPQVEKNIVAFPQDNEANEYRYINAHWLDEIAKGLTAGAVEDPRETWKQIPAREHLARALRHINMMRMNDTTDDHIINASMRLMMAFVTKQANQQIKGDIA